MVSDHGQVAWRKVSDTTPADQLPPIPSKFLSYFGPGATAVNGPNFIKVAFQGGKAVLEWILGTLQSSDDLRTWKDETGATSPFSITPSGTKFYRVKN